MLKEIVVVLRAVVLVIVLLLIAQRLVHGNSATATKLKTARNIAMSGAVSGSAKFDGSGNISIVTTQANIAVLTGNIEMVKDDEGLTGSVTLSYPEGFTRDNCVPIAKGISNNSTSAELAYAYGFLDDTASSYMGGRFRTSVSLSSTGIVLKARYLLSGPATQTRTYKIVLMKV